MLTDPAFIRRLESLHLLARKVLGGQLQADRKTTKKGSGVTFADYAEYALGDDHRAIDWRVYGRMEELMIKLFEVEQEMTLYILLDASPSMAGPAATSSVAHRPSPLPNKFLYARQLAAALGYIALNNMDQVVLYALADDLRTLMEPGHGRGRILPILRALEDAEPFGSDTRFNACTQTFQLRHRRRGMVVVISDFLFPDGFEQGLKFLQWNGQEIFCLQVQDDADRRCELKGDVSLECVESGATQRVTVTRREALAYENAVRDWNETLKQTCARRGIGLVSTTPDVPFDTVVQRILRKGGLVA